MYTTSDTKQYSVNPKEMINDAFSRSYSRYADTQKELPPDTVTMACSVVSMVLLVAMFALTAVRHKEEAAIWIAFGVASLAALGLILAASLLPAARGYTVPILTAYFAVFGLAAGAMAAQSLPAAARSFLRGVGGALPTIVFIALAASIKYIFDKGGILPTIVNQINAAVSGRSPAAVALILYLIVLVLEFFISSSTAKAILVMGILSIVYVGLSKQMLVLVYLFADGYTNVLFPTSPVLLLSLAMLEMDYFSWIKRSWPLFLANLLLVFGFMLLGIAAGY